MTVYILRYGYYGWIKDVFATPEAAHEAAKKNEESSRSIGFAPDEEYFVEEYYVNA